MNELEEFLTELLTDNISELTEIIKKDLIYGIIAYTYQEIAKTNDVENINMKELFENVINHLE